MNNRRKKPFRILAAMLCIALVFGVCTGYQARAEGTVYYASDQQSLLKKIKSAKDGDIIQIDGTIEVTDLGSPDKQIILDRVSADSRIVTQQGVPATIQNITFDGSNLNSSTPILTIQGGEFTVENCIFENCGDPEFKGSSGSIGGAVQVKSGEGSFVGCSFRHNTAVAGGHIAIMGNAAVSFYDCALLDGRSGSGGAISINKNADCIIEGCTITENVSFDYGGGIANGGNIQVRRTKLFNNQTVNGGADIANKIGGTMVLEDSLETLQELFADERIIVHGWVCDYDFEGNIYIPDVEPTEENLLMLDFEYMQPEPEEPEEPTKPAEPETPDEPTTPEEPGESETPTEPETPDQPTQPENPDEPTEPTTPDESSPSGNEPEQKPDNAEPTNPATPSDSAGESGGTTTNSSSESSTDNSNRSTNSNTTIDNSRRTSTSDSNNTSTVNNYYTQQPETQLPNNQPEVQTIVVPVGSGGNGEPIEQTIKIESSPERSVVGSAEGMTLNVNVNVGSEDTQQQPAATAEQQSGVSWYQAAVLCLLSAILVCLIRKR